MNTYLKKQTEPRKDEELCAPSKYPFTDKPEAKQKLRGEAMLQRIRIYAPVKIKGYKPAF